MLLDMPSRSDVGKEQADYRCGDRLRFGRVEISVLFPLVRSVAPPAFELGAYAIKWRQVALPTSGGVVVDTLTVVMHKHLKCNGSTL